MLECVCGARVRTGVVHGYRIRTCVCRAKRAPAALSAAALLRVRCTAHGVLLPCGCNGSAWQIRVCVCLWRLRWYRHVHDSGRTTWLLTLPLHGDGTPLWPIGTCAVLRFLGLYSCFVLSLYLHTFVCWSGVHNRVWQSTEVCRGTLGGVCLKQAQG